MSAFKVLTDAEVDALEGEALDTYITGLETHTKREKARRLSKDITVAKEQEKEIDKTRKTEKTEESTEDAVTEAQKLDKFEKEVIAELTPKEE